MKVSQLIALLEEMPEDAEVRLAFQPSYPLAFGIGAVSEVREDADEDEDEEVPLDYRPCQQARAHVGDAVKHKLSACPYDGMEESPAIVWIAQGEHPSTSPYAPRAAWDGEVY